MLFKEDKIARAEHRAVRENAGWYRWTHDLVEVTGRDAEKFLDRLFVGAIKKTPAGRTKYTTMLNEDGKIIDDTIVMHMGEDRYWVSTLYAPQFIKWADAHKAKEDVVYHDVTQTVDMYAVQGDHERPAGRTGGWAEALCRGRQSNGGRCCSYPPLRLYR